MHDLDELWNRPGFLVRRLNQIHHAIFFDLIGKEVTPLQYGILTVLGNDKEGMSQGELVEQVGADRATLAHSLGPLSRRKYIDVFKSSSDRRKKIIRATLKGRRFMEKSEPLMRQAQMRLLDPLLADERDIFLILMKRLAKAHDITVKVSIEE